MAPADIKPIGRPAVMLARTAAATATEAAPNIPHKVVARRSAAVARLVIAANLASPCLAISRANSNGIGRASTESFAGIYPLPFPLRSQLITKIAEIVKRTRVNPPVGVLVEPIAFPDDLNPTGFVGGATESSEH
jgi:hypothetical protein